MNNCDITGILEEYPYPDIKEIWKIPNTGMIVVVTEVEISDKCLLYKIIERHIPEGTLIGIQTEKTMAYRQIRNDRKNKLLYPQPQMCMLEIEVHEDEENYKQIDIDKIEQITSDVIINYCKSVDINTTGYEVIAEALINEKEDKNSLLENLKNEFCERKLQLLSYEVFRHLSENVAKDMLHKYSGDKLVSELVYYYWEHPDLFD